MRTCLCHVLDHWLVFSQVVRGEIEQSSAESLESHRVVQTSFGQPQSWDGVCQTFSVTPTWPYHVRYYTHSFYVKLIFCITALVLLHLSVCGIAPEYVNGRECGCVVLPGLRNGFLAKSEHLCFLNEQSFWSGKVTPGVSLASLTYSVPVENCHKLKLNASACSETALTGGEKSSFFHSLFFMSSQFLLLPFTHSLSFSFGSDFLSSPLSRCDQSVTSTCICVFNSWLAHQLNLESAFGSTFVSPSLL